MNLSEENAAYEDYLKKAKSIRPVIAIMSIQHWRAEGRPTAEQWYKGYQIPPPGETHTNADEGVQNTMSTDNTTSTTETAAATAPAKAPRPAGAKTLVRKVYEDEPNGAFTVEELASKTGKPTSSITTAISDLKSEKYAKPGAPLVLHRHKDGKYSLTAEVVEPAAAPAAGTDAAQTAAPADALPA